MEIVIKISDEELSQLGSSEDQILQVVASHLKDIIAVPIAVSMAPRGAIRVPGFIMSKWDAFNKRDVYDFITCDMRKYGYTMICPYTLEFDLPPTYNAISAAVDGLRAQQSVIREEFEVKNQAFESQIKDLLCLTYDVK